MGTDLGTDSIEAACIAWAGREDVWHSGYQATQAYVRDMMRHAIVAYLRGEADTISPSPGEGEWYVARWLRETAAELSPPAEPIGEDLED